MVTIGVYRTLSDIKSDRCKILTPTCI